MLGLTEEEIRTKAEQLKYDIQFALVMAEATGTILVHLHINKVREIYKLLDEISNGGTEE